MNPKIKEFLEVKRSKKAGSILLKYRKGDITVVIPEGINFDLDELIHENRDWLEDKVLEAQKFREEIPDRELKQDSEISVLGKDRKISVEKRRSNKVEENIFLAEHLVERTSLDDQLEKALRDFAREKFEEKASKYVECVQGDFNKIFVRDQKTRWGSCSSKNNLNFNWRLILGPENVLKYVVVHELVHLEVNNHSKKFWQRVEKIMPDYKTSERWLKDNSAHLEFNRE